MNAPIESISTPKIPLFFEERNTEPRFLRYLLICIGLIFLGVFLFMPLIIIFSEAFSKGYDFYCNIIKDYETINAAFLTMFIAFFSVLANLIFGIAAAWTIAKFDFIGKKLLLTLIDLPFSVSPVISGLIFVLLLGSKGPFNDFFMEHNIRVIYAFPGMIIVTIFITFPFIVRELIPVMQAQGTEEEEAALLMGANGWQVFLKITLPNSKWGLIYGIILCNARAMGEFGAVSVVSGHIRGETNTLPLQVEILYNEYQFTAAFAVATLLTFLALGTLTAKSIINRDFLRKGRT